MNSNSLRSWLPVIITAVTVLGFFFTQTARISALEVKAATIDQQIQQGGPQFLIIIQKISVLETKMDSVIKAIDRITPIH